MQRWIIGIAYFLLLGNSILLIESSPSAFVSGGVASFGSNRREQHAEFGESIRDWFRNLGKRFFGRSGEDQQSSLPPAEAGNMMLELENEDPQERKRNYPGGFFLDISRLSFNPETDWGFRLGRWYFIKISEDPSTDDWKSFQPPDNSEWPTSNENTDHVMEPSLITEKPDHDVTTLETSTPSEETSKFPDKKEEDNETRDTSDKNRSTEVLMPSE